MYRFFPFLFFSSPLFFPFLSSLIFFSLFSYHLFTTLCSPLFPVLLFRYTPHTCDFPACYNDAVLCPNISMCEPRPLPVIDQIGYVVVLVFSADYFLRVVLSGTVPARLCGLLPEDWDKKEVALAESEGRDPRPDPDPFSWYYQMACYSKRMYSLIDLISVLPFYISFAHPVRSLVFFRILRLTKIISLLKIPGSKEYAGLVKITIKSSLAILAPLVLYVAVIIVMFGCLIYIAECGSFQVSPMYPQGAFIRPTAGGLGQTEESPFRSIPDALYFVVITTTTIGYGDLYPTTELGRFFSCLFVYVGILITAFPIAIIGQNFVEEYMKLIKEITERVEESRAALLTDSSLISDDVDDDKLVLEAKLILKTLLSDTVHLSSDCAVLTMEGDKVAVLSSLLRQIITPPGDWETE